MGGEPSPQRSSPSAPSTPLPGRRRSATGAEQARRKAWGREWGQVGADYRRQRLERETT